MTARRAQSALAAVLGPASDAKQTAFNGASVSKSTVEQEAHDSARVHDRRPLQILGVGILLTGALLATAGWLAWSAYRTTTRFLAEELRLRELRGTILHLNEVLTMSAYMAAATADHQWEQRYRQVEPMLDAALKEAVTLAPEALDAQAAARTDRANHALAAMEKRAFELIGQGKRDAAAQMLSSTEYERQKEAYADGITGLDSGLVVHAQKHDESYRRRLVTMEAFGLIAVALLVLGWIAALTALQAHLKRQRQMGEALKNAHWELERQVEERTRELAQANRRLREEIADRRQSEAKVKQAKQILENIAQGITDEVLLLSPDLRIIWANGAALESAKLTAEDVVGQYCYAVSHRRSSPCEPPVGMCPVADAVRTGRIRAVTHTHRDGSGNESRVETTVCPIRNERGDIVQLVHVSRDVTQRDRAEEELRSAHRRTKQLLEAIPSILISVDAGNRVTGWNTAAECVLGLKAEQALGRELGVLEELGWDHAIVARGLSQCRAQNRPVRIDEIGFRRPDGTDGFLGLTMNSMDSGPDRDGGALLVAADITEQKILQSQLTQAQKLESIGQLAAGIAHEINTPIQYVGDNARFLQQSIHDLLDIVDRYAELLDPAKEPRDWRERATEVQALLEELDVAFLKEELPKAIAQSLEGVERVARIVRSMKEFSHPGGDEKQMADLNRAIETTITVARNEWKYVSDLITDFDPELPPVPCLVGDFNQVILNMIVNATHAISDVVGKSSGEKGTITVSTRRDEDWAEVRISDTGTGIPPEIRSKIFDPFFTTKEVGKGTGQGLAIAHATVVKKHGGELRVETEVGRGTTFVIRLPLEMETGSDAGMECHEEAHSLRG
jgi:PAS domain S-box-containing protein